jgi:hypothetical protein
LERLEVQVNCMTETGSTPGAHFDVIIDVGPSLSIRERTILFNSARRCEVSKILTGKIDMAYALTCET